MLDSFPFPPFASRAAESRQIIDEGAGALGLPKICQGGLHNRIGEAIWINGGHNPSELGRQLLIGQPDDPLHLAAFEMEQDIVLAA